MRSARVALFCLLCALCCPQAALAAEGAQRAVLLDSEAGYMAPLPAGWEEAGPDQARAAALRAGALFVVDGAIPGASGIRGALYPADAAAAPVLAVFTLDYAALGLAAAAADKVAEDARSVAAALSLALQEEYARRFPRSILVHTALGEDYFSLQLRTEDDPPCNRHLKVMLAARGAVALAAQYDGPVNTAYEIALAGSVRETRILPGHTLQSRLPAYRPGLLDYLLLPAAVAFAAWCLARLRAWMKS